MAGVPIKAVQEYLGHADLQTTMRYAHLSPTRRQQYIHVLDGPAPSRESDAAGSFGHKLGTAGSQLAIVDAETLVQTG
jgi:hypothetical protein